jgi:plastocyanin
MFDAPYRAKERSMQHPYAIVRKAWFPALLLTVALTALSCGSSGGGYGGNPTGPGTTKELNSGNIAGGATYTHRFTTAGTYSYHCIYHSPMTGSVHVQASAVDTLVQVNIVSSMSPFPGATVKTGGKVVWKNNTGTTHTVTSN